VLIMAHGDDAGLRVPPVLAPVQVVVLAVRDEGDVVGRCHALGAELADAGVRVRVDDRADVSLGRRATDWELKGVPVRLEIGPRDLADGVATLVSRVAGEKRPVPLSGIAATVTSELAAQQAALLTDATAQRDARTAAVSTLADARAAAGEGWARVPWAAVGTDGEAELAQDGVTVRCLLRLDGSVPDSDAEPELVAVVARAY
jgi:prolyl-tRNA synthetase